ncbi:MipA/OmpV family protein [Aliikangiella sp. IMCC44359]|uniref:MipA/OmpV family protein n=1 Tax=Aliikangiella sp. IMCC44359 TaxID=3459125 RepID=UPI00403AF374
MKQIVSIIALSLPITMSSSIVFALPSEEKALFYTNDLYEETKLSSGSSKENQIELLEADNEESNFSYDFKLLTGIVYTNNLYLGYDEKGFNPALTLTLDMDYYDFFFESNRKNRINSELGRVYIGYHLWENDNYQLDIISGSYAPAISKENEDGEPVPELINLNERENDYNFGARFSKLDGSTYYSLELVYDLASLTHNGWILDSYAGKVHTIGNWDITYGLGHTWYSENTSNYFLGIKKEEVAPGISSYKTGASYAINLEFSAQYPISESWVFEATLTHNWLSKNISESPLIIDDSITIALIGFGYVF